MSDGTVPLPNDGGAWWCSWTERGDRCNAKAKRGLSVAEYERRKPPPGVTWMRAMCPDHLRNALSSP